MKLIQLNLVKNRLIYLRKNNFGYVFQNIELNEYLTIKENIQLPMLINKKILPKERTKLACDLLNKFGLLKRANHYPSEVSGGEKQRICIARALANNPQVILCDEPTSSLDKVNSKKVFTILRKLADEGYCVIVATHDEKVLDYVSICLKLLNGQLYEVKK